MERTEDRAHACQAPSSEELVEDTARHESLVPLSFLNVARHSGNMFSAWVKRSQGRQGCSEGDLRGLTFYLVFSFILQRRFTYTCEETWTASLILLPGLKRFAGVHHRPQGVWLRRHGLHKSARVAREAGWSRKRSPACFTDDGATYAPFFVVHLAKARHSRLATSTQIHIFIHPLVRRHHDTCEEANYSDFREWFLRAACDVGRIRSGGEGRGGLGRPEGR